MNFDHAKRKKKVSIWGSTGSIGAQTLAVISRYPDRFEIETLTAHSNINLLREQAEKFRPKHVVLTGLSDPGKVKDPFKGTGADCAFGMDSLVVLAGSGGEDLVVNALVGSAGLEAMLAAIRARRTVALANKEVLVIAGELVMAEAAGAGVEILPIDSEHSAIFQCLRGEPRESIRRIILTASGGPFLNRPLSELGRVTVEEALRHPNWVMGKKVTIDSATLMNKGLEIIEARWLFGLEPDRIDVIIHPKSIIHSMVEFQDGSIKAQLGKPDMRVPISHALTYPERWPFDFGSLDLGSPVNLEFLPMDSERFPGLGLARTALEKGGTAPAVFNAADEMAVNWFLERKIGFMDIPRIVEKALKERPVRPCAELKDVLQEDAETREWLKKSS
jgi:1-deoxy-D-xylulose-5-phosphate reductoisomerase